ncbi:MAG TPA: tyrosine-type recombinase/integrase [Candidatus Didemnitutus sp.]
MVFRYQKSAGTIRRTIKLGEGAGFEPALADIRTAAAASLGELLSEYENDLNGRGLDTKHVHDSVTRVHRLFAQTGWRRLGDIRTDAFVKWRASLICSAKTAKEYQVSACAFLNWLVRTDRLATNPLAKVDKIDVRGKQVRASRTYTEAELARLFAVTGKYAIGYQVLLYTARRWSEVHALVWGDLHFDQDEPFALFREGTTKDKDKCAVPLKVELADELRLMRPADFTPTDRVLRGRLANYELFRKHLKRAGIEHKDALGFVLHLHSFRKTWQTLGVRYGVNQRAAQEVLGHSDANLTAKAYTDVPALALGAEVAKVPWISTAGESAQRSAQKSGNPGHSASLTGILAQLIPFMKEAGSEELSHLPAFSDALWRVLKLGAGAGFEPATFRL